MKKIISQKNLRYLAEIFCLYLVLLGIQALVIDKPPALWQGRIFSVAILLSLGRIFFAKAESYYLNLALQGVLLGSTVGIKFILGEPINQITFCTQIGYTLGLLNLLFLVNRLCARHWLSKSLTSVFYLLAYLPTILIWGYYFTTKSYINVDAILAILQTNYSEALEYLSTFVSPLTLVAAVLVLGFIACLPQLSSASLRLSGFSKPVKALFVLFIIGNIILVYKSRVNIISSPFFEAQRFTKTYSRFAQNKEQRKANIHLNSEAAKGIYVVIIGESHSRNFTSAYGYPQDTTPWLRSMHEQGKLLLYPHAFSCHVQTVPCVTYAMTAKNQYNKLRLEDSLTLLEVAEAAGFSTVWMSNQSKFGLNDTPITAIASEADQQIWLNEDKLKSETTSLDGALLPRLDELQLQDNMLIVIHLMGSHVAYAKRYPADYDLFGHDTPEKDYANALRYTDHVIEEIYNHFSQLPNFQSLIYFSDHGEVPGIGHNVSHYEHNMTHIPFFILCSDKYQQEHGDLYSKLQHSYQANFTNDLIYNNVLSLMDIHLQQGYEANNDLLNSQYDGDINRFRTLHGRERL